MNRRAIQWENFLDGIIKKIEDNGYEKKLWKPEIERLILRHTSIKEIEKDIVNGFQGIEIVNKEVEAWMKGKPHATPISGDK